MDFEIVLALAYCIHFLRNNFLLFFFIEIEVKDVQSFVDSGRFRWYMTNNPKLKGYLQILDGHNSRVDAIYCWGCRETFSHIRNGQHTLRHRERCSLEGKQPPTTQPNPNGNSYCSG